MVGPGWVVIVMVMFQEGEQEGRKEGETGVIAQLPEKKERKKKN